MSFKLDTKSVEFLPGAPAVASEKYNEDKKAEKEQATDAETGLLVWTVDGFLYIDGKSEIIKLKVLGEAEPVFEPGKKAIFDGQLFLTAYIPRNSTRVAYSYKFRGALNQSKN